jgi:hypothetical protein
MLSLAVSRRERFQALKARLGTAQVASPRHSAGRFLTSLEALDALLGEELAYGTFAVLQGPGCWSIAAALLAQATGRGIAAVIDGGELYPPSLEDAGVRLDRVMIVPARTPHSAARAADTLLRSRVVRIVVMPAFLLRAAIWARLAVLTRRSGVLLIAVGMDFAADACAVAGVRVACCFDRVVMEGSRGIWCVLAGFDARAEVRRSRRGYAPPSVLFQAMFPVPAR